VASPDPFAGSFGNMVRQILEDCHLLVDEAKVKRKIIDSIRFHASNRYWWSDREFQFALTAGVASYAPGDGYGLPGDLQEIVGDRMKLWYGGDEAQAQPVCYLTQGEFDDRRESDTTAGTPDGWTFFGNRLKLIPTPNSSTDIITAPYVVNVGVPKYRWNGTTYDFLTPDGQTLTDDYTSDWFQFGTAEQLIRFRATSELLKTIAGDWQTPLGSWLEAKSRLEDESEGKRTGGMTSLRLRIL
jgi:hypothetical protein